LYCGKNRPGCHVTFILFWACPCIKLTNHTPRGRDFVEIITKLW
jgi:hypothetical protein